MKIKLFQEITTEDYLNQLQKESDRFTGLYVDMANDGERKYVKDKASLISGLLKKLDRMRIDNVKSFRDDTEKEAASIRQALEKANLPFTLLIDSYTAERKRVLDLQKEIDDAKELIIQYGLDHADALIFDKVFDFELAEEARKQTDRDSAIRDQAAANATKKAEAKASEDARQVERARQQEHDKEVAEKRRREADKEHRRAVNDRALKDFVASGFSQDEARKIVKIIARKLISGITINY